MRIIPIISYKPTFKGIIDNNYYTYVPREPYTPQRQAIESMYDKKKAELAELIDTYKIGINEYQNRSQIIEEERRNAIDAMDNE